MPELTNPKSIKKLFAFGLLIVAGTQLLSHLLYIPDLIIGAGMGVGFGIEIKALLMLKKIKAAR